MAGTGANRFRSHPSCPWPLLSQEELEGDTPSRRQGMPAKKERAMCGSLAKMIRETGAARERAVAASGHPVPSACRMPAHWGGRAPAPAPACAVTTPIPVPGPPPTPARPPARRAAAVQEVEQAGLGDGCDVLPALLCGQEPAAQRHDHSGRGRAAPGRQGRGRPAAPGQGHPPDLHLPARPACPRAPYPNAGSSRERRHRMLKVEQGLDMSAPVPSGARARLLLMECAVGARHWRGQRQAAVRRGAASSVRRAGREHAKQVRGAAARRAAPRGGGRARAGTRRTPG